MYLGMRGLRDESWRESVDIWIIMGFLGLGGGGLSLGMMIGIIRYLACSCRDLCVHAEVSYMEVIGWYCTEYAMENNQC